MSDKDIVISSNHPIAKYFPHVEHSEKTVEEFRTEALTRMEGLKEIQSELAELRVTDYCINFRFPVMLAHAARHDIQGKRVVHIGAGHQDLDQGFLKWCKSLVSIEIASIPQRLPPLPNYTYIGGTDYKDVISDISGDVYYIWCGYKIDSEILNDLVNNHGKKGTFLLGLPQSLETMTVDLELLEAWSKSNECEIDYIPIIFDETEIQGGDSPLWKYCKENPEWSDWQTFELGRGVIFLMKVVVH